MDKDKASVEDAVHWMSELFREIALEKKASRESGDTPQSKRKKFWKWLVVNGSSLSVIVTVLSVLAGGIWTAQQYFAQRREQIKQEEKAAELRKETLIAQFAGDLGDKDKRNGAALAIAVLAKDAAIPILESHLRDTVFEDEADKRFRTSLVQAFISIGPASLPRLLALNREVNRNFDTLNQHKGLDDVTQRVIIHFLKNDPEYFSTNNLSLSGVHFRNANFDARLDGLNLNGVWFYDSAMCAGSFKKANLSGAHFGGNIQLGSSNMEEALLDKADFSGESVTLTAANLNRAKGVEVDFSSCQLDYANVKDAMLKKSNFKETILRNADFSNTQLGESDFQFAELHRAKFINADLTGTNMRGADLESVDFTGANLSGVHFNTLASETPLIPGGSRYYSAGALVRGANFSNAKNLYESARMYLCKWGAVNVPGGCNGIAQADFKFERRESGFGASICW
jgi:uncharacterized protein YjbI with pentapeptide repeats